MPERKYDFSTSMFDVDCSMLGVRIDRDRPLSTTEMARSRHSERNVEY